LNKHITGRMIVHNFASTLAEIVPWWCCEYCRLFYDE